VSADATSTINFKSSCGTTSTTLSQTGSSGAEITSVCPGQTTSCSGGSMYGLQQYIYQGQITLTPCSDWVMSYTMCCRNPSNTIYDPTNADIYIPATLNSVAAPCNSSPSFTSYPSTIICLNQQFCYNHGAVDPDGDSLSYSLITPYDDGPGGSTPNVSYISPYTAQQPLPSSPPITIDPITGDICMTPTQNITSVFSVLVKEWRHVGGNIVCVGSVLRDMQITVISCTNQLPTLAGINPAATQWSASDTTYKWYMCAGETLDFIVFPHDGNTPAENLDLTWNSGIPNATWSVTDNNTPNAQGHFSWTPTIADVSNAPYCFTATIKDDHCPYVGLQAFSYCVFVTGVGVVLEPPNDTTLCAGLPYTLIAHADTSVTSLDWTIDGNPATPINDSTLVINTSTLGIGTHTVEVLASGGIASCSGGNMIHITINSNLSLTISPPNPSVCNGDAVTLTANGGDIYTWSPPTALDTIYGPTVSASPTINTTYTVNGSSNAGCTGSTTTTVTISTNLNVGVTPQDPEICSGGGITLTATGALNYTWSPQIGLNPSTGAVVNASPGSTTTYVVTGDNNNSCTGSASVTVHVGGLPEINFVSDSLWGCAPFTVHFFDQTTPAADSWYWDFGDYQSNYMNHSTHQNPIHIYQYPGSYGVTLTISAMGGCSGSLYIPDMIKVLPNPIAFFTYVPPHPNDLEPMVMFNDESILAQHWLWDFGDSTNLNNHSSLENPIHVYSDTGVYYVTLVVSTNEGCHDTTKQAIYVEPTSSFYCPSAFTPNNDGKNEVFICKGVNINNSTFNLSIFDRWGKNVFKSYSIADSWNGQLEGGKAPEGVYTWIITYNDINGKFYRYRGVVTLYR